MRTPKRVGPRPTAFRPLDPTFGASPGRPHRLLTAMRAFHLDAVYARAEGDHLYQQRGTDTIRVLDLVGGFGTTLVGHHNAEIVAELRRLIDAKVPFSAQLSARPIAATLERLLRARLGAYRVVFTNSGTETVEAALKHAYLERPRQIFWAVRGSFHGKTLGAIQLTYAHRKPFRGLGPHVRFLDPWDDGRWASYEGEVDRVSAAIVEPILGEGGVIPLPPEFLSWLSAVCRRSGIPLIADEIQTGLGRTGTFLASEAAALDPDYICLAKGLGGGIAKLGALLVREERFVEAFSWLHTSTFAGDEIGCGIAGRVLEILERDEVPARCAALGTHLLGQLRHVQASYPAEIADVRGRGLLVGVELGDAHGAESNVLRAISAHGLMGVLASSYLLNRHGIRVAPCLGHPATLRVEPSAYVERSELDRFVDALGMFCRAVRAQDVPHLLGHLIDRPRAANGTRPQFPHLHREAPETGRRVAFIAHAIGPADLRSWDPSLASFDTHELDALTRAAAGFLGPVVYDELHVRAPGGARVHLSLIGLFYTSAQLFDAYRARRHDRALGQIEQALALARARGCTVAGLGGFHSIVASNGTRLHTRGIGLTTGNALTVGMGIRALTRAAGLAGIDLGHATLAVVGATGNIAQAYALSMAPAVRRLVLVTRPGSSGRCRTLAARLRDVAPRTELQVSESLDVLRGCHLILSASNAPEPVIYLRHLGPHPTVICDVSLPSDVAEEVAVGRSDVVVLNGGVVRLPCDPDLVIPGLPLAPGHVYACMAETLLMGLEGLTNHGSYGPLTPDRVQWALGLADKHGFALAALLTSSLLTA